MSGISHIMSPLSAPWCGWIMFGLLLCAILSEWSQPGVITQAKSSLLPRNDRAYKESPVTLWGQFFVTLFRIGTLSMALCLCWEDRGTFSFGAFGAICGMVTGVIMLKMLLNGVLDYTFMLSRRFGTPHEHYSNLFTLMALVLYPIVLVLVYVGSAVAACWSLAIIAALFGLIWLYRCIRTFIQSPMAILYVALYFCSLELLPFAGLAYISAKTMVIL